MSGKFTRNHDDPCNIINQNNQDVQRVKYNMYQGQQKNCSPCLTPYGAVPNGRYFTSRNKHLTDIESKLKGQNSRPDFNCGREKTWFLDVTQFNVDSNPQCVKELTPIESLMTHPKEYYRELEQDRFYDLPIDNENWVFWDYSVNTRAAAKDAFVQKYPKPLSQNPALPPAQRTYPSGSPINGSSSNFLPNPAPTRQNYKKSC